MSFLELQNVKTHFPIFRGILWHKQIGAIKAVDGVDLKIEPGETLGLVGESGCGKSTLARTIMQIVKATSGEIRLEGHELTGLNAKSLRGKRRLFQMIFQDPYASLNPRMTVFDLLAEPLIIHKICPKTEIEKCVSELMKMVGLAPRFIKKFPHEFSGGQRQRIAIARALAVEPKLILADEAVSALDVSIQSQILNLLMKLKARLNLTMIFISHDLSVVKHISDRIAIMYLGKIVEIGKTEEIFKTPLHPYTQALLSAVPLPDPKKERQRKRKLLDGDPPSPINPPQGCYFHPRCPYADKNCQKTFPEFIKKSATHQVACIKVDDIIKLKN